MSSIGFANSDATANCQPSDSNRSKTLIRIFSKILKKKIDDSDLDPPILSGNGELEHFVLRLLTQTLDKLDGYRLIKGPVITGKLESNRI